MHLRFVSDLLFVTHKLKMASIFDNYGRDNNKTTFIKDLARKRALERQAFQLCLGLCKKKPISAQRFASTVCV